MGNVESFLHNDHQALEAAIKMQIETQRINRNEAKIGGETRDKLFSYIANIVPLIMKIEKVNGVEKAIIDKKKWEELVEQPLCKFICDEEPDQGLENLQLLDNPSQLCGKIFKVGDPAYTCKDCAADPTCVFCHDCFSKSAHVNHRYRMHASCGNGGFCDCGDAEAWKRDPSCEVHLKGNDFDSDLNPKDVLPQKVLEKATFIYNILLQYCVDMVLWTDNDNLPEELRRSNADSDVYLTLLFNDEVHTYDQVIRSLQQAVKCEKSEAIRYASIVDKEGRSLIFNGSKQSCEAVCKVVKRCTFRDDRGSLKCDPIKQEIVAHQEAAIELLTLLNKITSYSAGLRRLLCELSLNTIEGRPESLLDQLLKSDTSLWKVARAGCHQLFMNAVLLDLYGKKEFSKSFAKNYTSVMTDFVKDDHDHGLSASSVSVQIFTVPTITQMLVMDHNILHVVFQTFYQHIENSFTDAGHIDFQNGKNGRSLTLKREYYILHDIGYLLHNKPEKWTPQLVEKFMAAFEVFARILKGMQGMEQVVRKLVTHIEYEPNWESGFLMQLWMMPVIEAMVSWCVSDTDILKETMRRCLETLLEGLPALKFEPKFHPEVDPNFLLVNYDVATQPASVHMGLSRFMAGLVTGCTRNGLSLEKLLLMEGMTTAQNTEKLLAICEYPLRTLVFAAQVSAGMWRRNGYAVLHQVSYYQNVRCVSEMYDRDIIMLQTVAALINSNHFLTVLLEKYGLLDWLRLGFEETGLDEDSQRRIIVISEEFLLTVLAVLGERHVLGIGEVSGKEILRKEVVHRLALGPASRSEIVKNLPSRDPDDEEDCTLESQLDEVLQAVADFREPWLTGKGLYQLKPLCLEECGQYFYHYSRSEQSKALEQRRKESKKSTPSACCKVPMPATFTRPFMPITKIFCCDKMAKILTVVLFRASKSESKITPDTLIEEALYIIALGLFEEKRKRENHLTAEENFLDVVTRTLGVVEGKPVTIQGLLHDIQTTHKNQEYSELVSWIVQMLLDELSHRNDDKDETSQQNKRKQNEIDHGAKADKERRARLAKEKREKVMAQMSQMQKSFIKKYENFLDLEDDTGGLEDVEMEEALDLDKPESVAVGPSRTLVKPKISNVICILCQEKEDITAGARTIVMAAFLQRSKVMSKSKGRNITDVTDYNPLFTPRDLFTGVFTSSCGHVMHADCWQKYFDSVKDREGRQLLRLHFHPRIDVNKNEYLCPLCSSLSNTVIPLLPEVESTKRPRHVSECNKLESARTDLTEEEMLTELHATVNQVDEEGFVSMVETNGGSHLIASSSSSISALFHNILYQGSNLSNGAHNMVYKFANAVRTIGVGGLNNDRASELVMAWSTCAYTIQCTECILRDEKKPLFALSSRQTDCIRSLVRFSTSSCSLADELQTNRNCLNLLSALITSHISQDHSPSILTIDPFGVMINLRLTLQTEDFATDRFPVSKLVASGAIDRFVLKLALQAQLTQTLLCCPAEITECDESFKNLANAQIKASLAQRWGKAKHAAGANPTPEPHKQAEQLFCHVVAQCLPFIRCCALFFHFLTGAQPPSILTKQDEHDHISPSREIYAICHYLSLPTNIVSVLPMEDGNDTNMAATELMMKRWYTHDSVKQFLGSPHIDALSLAAAPIRLIPLPREYSKLITTSSGFRCPMTGDISQNPTMCLVCGEMLCSQSYCCLALVDEKQIGSCTAHAETCNETVGIFLRIRDCQILLLYNKSKGCFKPSPYLDEYGEPDYKFRRGNPLYLSLTRYNNLQKMWLSHLIPEEIVRQMELSRSFLAYEWSQY